MKKIGESSPQFKALKQHKKNWNKATKELIDRIIAFKRALNGTGESKYSLPKSKIGEPIPREISSFLDTLSSNYESVANEALKIINEQNDFAQQRASAAKTASLKVEASSKLSRLWAYLKSPFLSDENKKLRLTLLNSLSSLEITFKDLEGNILSSGDKSIIKSIELLDRIFSEFKFINKAFDSLIKADKSDSSKETKVDKVLYEEDKKDFKKSIDDALKAISDIRFASNIPGAESHVKGTEFDNLVINFNSEKTIENKEKLANKIISMYESLLEDANDLYRKNAKSFQELFELVKNKKSASSSLIITADNFISKWLKEKKHQLSPFDKTSASRLAILEISKVVRDEIDKLMSALETGLNPDEVKNSLINIEKNIILIKEKMEPLRALIHGKMFKPDTELMSKMLEKDFDKKNLERLKRKYDTVSDRKILDMLFK